MNICFRGWLLLLGKEQEGGDIYAYISIHLNVCSAYCYCNVLLWFTKVEPRIRLKSIETLKVHEKTLEYLRKNKFKTIEDIINRQGEIPSEFRGNIHAYLMFGIED